MNRAPAIWTTVVALALINLGIAATIVSLIQPAALWPLWIGLVLVAAGVATLAAAVRLWQRYLHDVRTRPAEARRG